MTTATTPTRSWYKRNEIAVTPWLFLLPGVIFFALYVIFPIFQSFWISFHEWDGLGEKTWVGTANYERLLGGDRKFETSFWNNVKWLVLYLLAIPMGLSISLFLNQSVRGIRLYKSLFFFPFVISQVVVGLVFSWFYLPGEQGLFNVVILWIEPIADPILFAIARIVEPFYPIYDFVTSLVLALVNFVKTVLFLLIPDKWEFAWMQADWSRASEGLPVWLSDEWEGLEAGNILGNPDTATYGIIAAGLWPQTAYCMILYLTGLNAVDPEQVEAARLDGAKGFKMLWYVIIPQLKPATFIAFVVTIIGALRSFDFIAVMTNGGPFGSTRVLSFYMFEESLSEFGFRMGYGAAIAVVLFVLMLIFITYFLWSMYQDEKVAR